MIAAPAAVSFLCSIFLAIFILVRRVRENVAKLALVAWLLGCNMVHGINASLWSTNVDLKALVWCDLGMILYLFDDSSSDVFSQFKVTKFVLATTIAVPAAFLCISRYLELVSSSRNLPTTVKAYRNRRITDAIICYLIPFLYMPLRTHNYSFQ
jgi:pheromone a factor receptor